MRAARGHRVVWILCRRMFVGQLRQPMRIASAIGTPLVLLAFMGAGFAGSFRPAGLGELSYSAYLLPGMMTLTAVFTAIFASIWVIEDRQHGWLQAALASPASRWSLAAGMILGGAWIAWLQGAAILAVGLWLLAPGQPPSAANVAIALAALALACTAMSALGLALACRSESTASFHAVMNLVLAPMWLLSGAFFPPPEGGAAWLGWLMRINPLTWCTQAIRGPLLDQPWAMPLLGATAFTGITVAVAILLISRPTERL